MENIAKKIKMGYTKSIADQVFCFNKESKGRIVKVFNSQGFSSNTISEVNKAFFDIYINNFRFTENLITEETKTDNIVPADKVISNLKEWSSCNEFKSCAEDYINNKCTYTSSMCSIIFEYSSYDVVFLTSEALERLCKEDYRALETLEFYSFVKRFNPNIHILHSASVLNENAESIVFWGKSGAGKSTVCNKLSQEGYEVISDELSILKIEANKVLSYGSPWSTDRRYISSSHKSFPVVRLFYLQKNREFSTVKMDRLNSSLCILNQLYPYAYAVTSDEKSLLSDFRYSKQIAAFDICYFLMSFKETPLRNVMKI